MTTVETLRRAAALMRERAAAATPGPWHPVPISGGGRARSDVRGLPENTTYDYRGDAVATTGDSEFGACTAANAEHVASWSPPVALAVADWLDALADESTNCAPSCPALAVARAYLGEGDA